MSAPSSRSEVPVLKNDSENAVPTCWRPVLREIVDALAAKDFALESGVLGVESVSSAQAEHIQNYVANYGATLVTLPDEAWETSVCMWNGRHSWDVLVDLWTQTEGRSDLVLSVRVTEQASDFGFKIHMVYVP